MNIEEKLTIFSDILAESGILVAKGIHQVNHRPHQFTIGPKHIARAHEVNGGILTEDVLEMHGCAHKGCGLPYSKHEADEVLFLQLTRNVSELEANDELLKIKPKLIELKVDGVAFVDTEEGYRFLKDEGN